ncbi:MAG TPA: hypothetical protein VFX59_14100, partial [Polyangiales bacterium]|nr:hypothetical protein [Polyangiales bacterium]
MVDSFRIERAKNDEATVQGLGDLLLDVVEGGASVGFMLPLSRERALGFWRGVLASAERGERI